MGMSTLNEDNVLSADVFSEITPPLTPSMSPAVTANGKKKVVGVQITKEKVTSKEEDGEEKDDDKDEAEDMGNVLKAVLVIKGDLESMTLNW